MHLFVIPGDWGDAQLVDIRTLLIDTASHLDRLLRTHFDGTIHVIHDPIDGPIALFRKPDPDTHIIKLSARNRKWNKFAYQFAHEFCHVLSDHDKLKNNPNNWFHEAICELSSFFVHRRMAERWRSEPPYSHWASYACNFEKYYHKTLDDYGINLTDNVDLNSWLLKHEYVLREDEYQRKKNALVAYELLPIFEETPTGWNAIRKLPTSTGYLKDYLIEWHSLVDEEDKPFVACISDAFGYTIT